MISPGLLGSYRAKSSVHAMGGGGGEGGGGEGGGGEGEGGGGEGGGGYGGGKGGGGNGGGDGGGDGGGGGGGGDSGRMLPENSLCRHISLFISSDSTIHLPP